MTPRRTKSARQTRPPDVDDSLRDPLYDDAALREAIARIMAEETSSAPLDAGQRNARVAALRLAIEGGEYMSDEKIGDIVDRLLKKWKL